MPTGIECAGLVLAILPLFIEAGKAYARGTDTLFNIASTSRRDQRLGRFYEEFWWEMVELNQKVKDILNYLPLLSPQRKIQLATAARLEDWTRDADINTALRSYFATNDDFNTFMHVMSRLVSLLAQLVKDSTVQVVAGDADQIQMYNKLKQFGLDRESGQTSSTFFQRFAFWRKEKHRTKCLEQLRIWNKRLRRLTNNAAVNQSPSGTLTKSVLSPRRVPTVQLHRLSQLLHQALSGCWDCCASRHDARFCLKVHEEQSVSGDEVAEFEFLVSSDAEENQKYVWQEGHILMQVRGATDLEKGVERRKICDALRDQPYDQRVCLLVEDLNGYQKMWQLRSQPRQLRIIDIKPPTTLEGILEAKIRLSLRDKRRLALILSHSLLQYHDSAWLCSEWGKSHISFFYSSEDKPDLRRPYLSTRFDNSCSEIRETNMSRFHPNPSILALGILLIEIDLERSITTTESVNLNTDWINAHHVVKFMDQCSEPYKEAIRACLDIPWIRAGQHVSLKDSDTRDGLYANVIHPLESEFDYLFPKQ